MEKNVFKGRIECPIGAGYEYEIVDGDNVLAGTERKVVKTSYVSFHFLTPADLHRDLWDFFHGVQVESVTLKNKHGQILEFRKAADEK
jgi:hypothetical protein